MPLVACVRIAISSTRKELDLLWPRIGVLGLRILLLGGRSRYGMQTLAVAMTHVYR